MSTDGNVVGGGEGLVMEEILELVVGAVARDVEDD